MDNTPLLRLIGPPIMCFLLAILISGCGIFERDMSGEANAAALVIAEDAAEIIEDTLTEFGYARLSVHGVVLADCAEISYGFTGNGSSPGHRVEYESTWSQESADSEANLADIQAAVVARLAPLGFHQRTLDGLGSYLASASVRVGPDGSGYRTIIASVYNGPDTNQRVVSLSTGWCHG